MDNTLISGIMLGLCLVIYVFYVVYNKVILPKKDLQKEQERRMSANEWTNVLDIDDDAIHTADGFAISVYKITPVNIELMTKKDKADFVKEVSAALSPIRTPYKLLAVPQPYDVQPYLDALQEQKSTGTDIQKLIIANEISYINGLVASGTMVEKRFYVLTWSYDAEDYKKEREDFIARWNDSRKLETQLLSRQELIQLCNLIYNPSVSDEIYDNLNNPILPMIRS